MIRSVRLLLLAALAFALVAAAHAQTPAQTWYTVAPEGASTSLTIPAGTTYQVGVASCPATSAAAWSAPVTVTAATTFNPLDLGTNAAAFPFADPCPNTVKNLQVLETSAVQVLTLNGASVSVPALATAAAPVNCPAPATFNANPTPPATPPNCAPLANEIAVCADGCSISELQVATPVFFQYCTGTGTGQVCDAPFMFIQLPITVGPNAQCGGPTTTGNTTPGTLYVQRASQQNSVTFSTSPGAPPTTLAVAAAAGS